MLRFKRLFLGLSVLFLLVACGSDEPPPLVFTPETLDAATVDEPYEATIAISQNVTPVEGFYVVEGELPPGLSLELGDDQTTIQGTPTEAGTYTFTLLASCFGTNVSGQQGEHQYTLVVN